MPRTLFFESKEGLRALRQEVQHAAVGNSISGCLHTTKGNEHLLSLKNTRLIVNADKDTPKNYVPETLRLVLPEDYPFTSDFFVFGNVIVLISDAESFGVRIESKEFAEVMNATFDLAWEEAGRLDAKLRKTTSKNSGKG